MLNNFEIRSMARRALKGNWLIAVLVCFIYALVCSAGTELGTVIPVAGFFASMFFIGPVNLGVNGFFLSMYRGRTIRLESIFEGFRNLLSAFLVALITWVFILLWALLLVIPGIIAALRYSQAIYILYDNPDIGALEAIERSKKMMHGYKGKLFFLYLSFFGWALLSILTAGIGFLWLAPYVSVSLAGFYEDLKLNQAIDQEAL